MLKKKIFLKIALLIFSSVLMANGYLFANCAEALQTQKNHDITIMIAGGATASGSWNMVAEGIAEIIRKELPGSNITVVTGSGSDSNIAMLQKGDVDLAISATDSAESAINGWGSFSVPFSLNDVQAIARLYDSKIQFVVSDNVEINSIEEIKEKKVPLKLSVNLRGSGFEKGARRILEEYGITFKDIESWGGRVFYFNQNESIRMMGDGQLNAFIAQTIVPLFDLTELAMKRNFKILPIPNNVIENMTKKYNYTSGIIAKGTYKGITEDITTICVANGLFASGKLDDQVAYLVTKALVNNIDSLRQIHSQVINIAPDYMNSAMVFPVHPGAQRAYQE